MATGVATWDEGLLLFLERSGYPEETYHTFSYSPVPDDAGAVGGMLCVVTEETERVLGERRLELLRELGAELAGDAAPRQTVAAVCAPARASDRADLPFTLALSAASPVANGRGSPAPPASRTASPRRLTAIDVEASA